VKRYAIGIEYSGTAYCGWQRQKHSVSVQQTIEKAIGFVANHPVSTVCAGRTDTGVHAVEQIAHFESPSIRSERAWLLGTNTRLPGDIRIKWVKPVSHDFSARFSAEAREYRYIILNTPIAGAIFHHLASWEHRRLDHQIMNECAQLLVGEHDFGAFRGAGCQSMTSHRNVHSVAVSRRGDLVFLDIKANAFLYHMVRNIAGSLISVGKGDQNVGWFSSVFKSADRTQAEVTAPAAGLYFYRAFYAEQFKLPIAGQKPVLF
jgi:tRNA pseudouridine38-40 synthase